MNKGEIIDALSKETNTTKADAGRLLDAFVDLVQKNVKKGTDVTIVGFGTWTKAKRSARTGRNPQTGETIKIKAKSLPKFKPGKAFKDMVAAAK